MSDRKIFNENRSSARAPRGGLEIGPAREEAANLHLHKTAWWGWEKYDTAFMSMIYLSGEGELGVGDDGTAVPHLIGAIEHLCIGGDELKHHIQQFADSDSTRARDEGALRAVALGSPLVLDRDGAVNDINFGIVVRIDKSLCDAPIDMWLCEEGGPHLRQSTHRPLLNAAPMLIDALSF
jgi:hypothetical protein